MNTESRSYLQSKLYELYCRETVKVTSPDEVVNSLKKYANKKTEYFLVITLDGAHNIIKVHEVTKGLANKTLVHPREIFIPIIKDGACAFIVAHNHPSGNTEPSREDDNVTEKIKTCAEMMEIPLLDHVIVSKYGYYSAVENGTL